MGECIDRRKKIEKTRIILKTIRKESKNNEEGKKTMRKERKNNEERNE